MIIEEIIKWASKTTDDLFGFLEHFDICNRRFCFERIVDLMIRTSKVHVFKGYEPVYDGYGNKKGLPYTLNYQTFIKQNINNGNKNGSVDLLLKNDKNKHIVMLSFKFFNKNEAKNIKDYDITELKNCEKYVLQKNPGYHINYGIVTNCNRDDLRKKLKKCKKSYADDIKYILCIEELNVCFENYKTFLKTKKQNFIKNICLRFYQDFILYKIQQAFKQFNKVLLGAIPRSGKTKIASQLILNELDKNPLLNVLFISDVKTNLKEDICDNFNEQDFDKFEKHLYTNLSKLVLNPDKPNLVVQSSQALKNHYKNFTDMFDLIIIDEAHIGGSTENLQTALKLISSTHTKFLYMTATFKKPLHLNNFSKSQLIEFGIYDVTRLMARDPLFIKEIETVLNRKIEECELQEFKYPKLHPIGINLKDAFKNILTELLLNNDDLTFFTNCFTINKDDADNPYFLEQNKRQISELFKYIFGTNNNSVWGQDLISQITNTYLKGRKPKVILCYLPGGKEGMNAKYVLPLTEQVFQQTCDMDMYHSLCICSEFNNRDVKKHIQAKLNEQPDKTLIIFVHKMLQTAITIPECDGVILLNDSKSEDELLQTIFRPCTWIPGKDDVFVLDANPDRITHCIVEYGFSNEQIKTKHDFKIYLKYIQHLIALRQKDIVINHDDFVEQIATNYFSNKNTDNLLDDVANSTIIDDKKLQFIKNNINVDTKTTKVIQRKLDINNKKSTKIKKEFQDQQDSGNEQESETESDNQFLQEQLLQKKIINYRNMISKMLYFLIILHYKKTDDIQVMLNIMDFNPISQIANRHFNTHISINQFKQQINEYSSYFISKLIHKIILDMNKKSKEQLYELISKFLKPNHFQKKQNGEVFTPLTLVKQMLDQLPEHVWNNPDYKWLDPAVGIGNFMIVVFERLMITLKDVIVDEEKRKKHILQNMLYVCDICPINICIYKLIMEYDEKCHNILTSDFLDNNTFKNLHFDVIVGNPPYQDASGNKGKGHTLWTNFITKIFTHLKYEKYLCIIHPPLWRQYNHPIQKLIKSKQLLYLEIHNVSDGLNNFKCSTRYDWYVLSNKPYSKNTIVKGEDGIAHSINLNEWHFIPNKLYDIIKKLVIHNESCVNILHSESAYEVRRKWMSHEKTSEHIYPCIYNINKDGRISLKWSKENTHGHFNIVKFIFCNGYGVLCDKEGQYGLTQWASGIVDKKENLINIQKCFESKDFKNVIQSLQIDSSKYNIKILKLFKKDFYKEFI